MHSLVDGHLRILSQVVYFLPLKKCKTGKWTGADLHKYHFFHYFILSRLERGFWKSEKPSFKGKEPAASVQLGWVGDGTDMGGFVGQQDLVTDVTST